jgi:N-acetylmuramoyl-L-alanine amidase
MAYKLNLTLKTNIANSENYSSSTRSTSAIKYIVLHYTANNGDTDEGNGNYFHNNAVGTSAHYFVDEDSATQAVPDNHTAWHCETPGMAFKCGCRNANSIGIEMCSDKVNGVYVITEQTKKNAVELTKWLMDKYSVPIANVIRHYDVCGKNCPEPWVRVSNEWTDFKKRLTTTTATTKVEEKTFKFVEATVSGKNCKFTGFTENSENWIKASAALEAVGYTAKWNGTKKRVIAVKNGKETLLDIRTYISVDSISFCPLRELYEYLGYTVKWNADSKSIVVE